MQVWSKRTYRDLKYQDTDLATVKARPCYATLIIKLGEWLTFSKFLLCLCSKSNLQWRCETLCHTGWLGIRSWQRCRWLSYVRKEEQEYPFSLSELLVKVGQLEVQNIALFNAFLSHKISWQNLFKGHMKRHNGCSQKDRKNFVKWMLIISTKK